MDAGIYTLPLFIPFFIQPVQFLPERTPGTRDHDGRFHAICQFDRLYYIYIFQLFWLCHWLFGCIMRKMKKTYVTDGIGPTAYRPSLVSCTFTCFHIPVFFFPQWSDFEQRGGGGERAYGYCQIWCTSCNWPAWEKNAPTGCYGGGDCVKWGDTSRCRGGKRKLTTNLFLASSPFRQAYSHSNNLPGCNK